MQLIESITRFIQTAHGVAMDGVIASGLWLLFFRLTEHLIPAVADVLPHPRSISRFNEKLVGVLLNQLGPKVDARTPSQTITAPLLLSIIGTIVIISMAVVQISSMSVAWGGAIVTYSAMGLTMPLENLFMSIVVLSALFAGSVMLEANRQIQRGVLYS
ncbi:hypothetical protein HYG81_00550 [Natrinema zhouii]|uniref:Uncharacterized protein n=1 Tax=Natrinema zhouii TaxID=1710539 RepID=A0A7D6CRG8_9EURY|nr:hypothetical protein [Natrinema zhouii]QLK26151.1 hypothetical protein HYG81_00550 [Natrinema zhouii]